VDLPGHLSDSITTTWCGHHAGQQPLHKPKEIIPLAATAWLVVQQFGLPARCLNSRCTLWWHYASGAGSDQTAAQCSEQQLHETGSAVPRSDGCTTCWCSHNTHMWPLLLHLPSCPAWYCALKCTPLIHVLPTTPTMTRPQSHTEWAAWGAVSVLPLSDGSLPHMLYCSWCTAIYPARHWMPACRCQQTTTTLPILV